MTGAEHYEQAELMLAEVTDADDDRVLSPDDAEQRVANTVAAAQVHATLALAAATADATGLIR